MNALAFGLICCSENPEILLCSSQEAIANSEGIELEDQSSLSPAVEIRESGIRYRVREVAGNLEADNKQETSSQIELLTWAAFDTYRDIRSQFWSYYDDPISRFKRPRQRPNA